MTTQEKYQKHVTDLRREKFEVENFVCRNPLHDKHIMATTYSCLESV